MRTNRKFLALIFIALSIGAAGACSLITDVDRSKIEGAGGADADDAGSHVGGNSATGGRSSVSDAGVN